MYGKFLEAYFREYAWFLTIVVFVQIFVKHFVIKETINKLEKTVEQYKIIGMHAKQKRENIRGNPFNEKLPH